MVRRVVRPVDLVSQRGQTRARWVDSQTTQENIRRQLDVGERYFGGREAVNVCIWEARGERECRLSASLGSKADGEGV